METLFKGGSLLFLEKYGGGGGGGKFQPQTKAMHRITFRAIALMDKVFHLLL